MWLCDDHDIVLNIRLTWSEFRIELKAVSFTNNLITCAMHKI